MNADQALAVLRKRLDGKSQKQLASEFGITQQYLSDILLGKRELTDTVLVHLGLCRRVSYHKIDSANVVA